MIVEGEPLRTAEGPSKLDEAKETIQTAADTVKVTTQRLGEAIDAGRRPGAIGNRLAKLGPRGATARTGGRIPGWCGAWSAQIVLRPRLTTSMDAACARGSRCSGPDLIWTRLVVCFPTRVNFTYVSLSWCHSQPRGSRKGAGR
jgi:hypothetical protein